MIVTWRGISLCQPHCCVVLLLWQIFTFLDMHTFFFTFHLNFLHLFIHYLNTSHQWPKQYWNNSLIVLRLIYIFKRHKKFNAFNSPPWPGCEHFVPVINVLFNPSVNLFNIDMTWHDMTWHDIASHRIASHRIASHRIASHRIASHHITSHHITSHHITSHHTSHITHHTSHITHHTSHITHHMHCVSNI